MNDRFSGRLVEILQYRTTDPSLGRVEYVRDDKGNYIKDVIEIGTFIGLGVGYEELRDGIGQYTVAIVERQDGSIEDRQLHLVRFHKPQPTGAGGAL